jgi:KDO2-lipid IV(A) lauroyltransferase
MSRILYYLILKPLSLLPLPVLHGMSTGIYWLLFRVIGYRKKVVMGNLERCFPEKSDAERRAIAHRFYRHFCDVLVESVRMFSMPDQDVADRMPVTNIDILDEYYERGQSIVLMAGHYTNWELATVAYPVHFKHVILAIYAELKDPFMEKKTLASRTRTGLQVIDRKRVRQELDERMEGLVAALTFVADQAPSNNRHHLHWTRFLGQPTGFFLGGEKYAKKYDLPVFYGQIRRHRRGHYSTELVKITDTPRAEAEGVITERYVRLLEAQIQAEPEFWLWTHRRWKREIPPEILARFAAGEMDQNRTRINAD